MTNQQTKKLLKDLEKEISIEIEKKIGEMLNIFQIMMAEWKKTNTILEDQEKRLIELEKASHFLLHNVVLK